MKRVVMWPPHLLYLLSISADRSSTSVNKQRPNKVYLTRTLAVGIEIHLMYVQPGGQDHGEREKNKEVLKGRNKLP